MLSFFCDRLVSANHRNIEILNLDWFVAGMSFQASQMFLSKAGAYPIEAPFKCPTLGVGFRPYPQTLG
jgi:hypothetical protein